MGNAQVTNKGRPVELKSMAVNKARPHEMAVAAGDPYLRVYDRRMLSPARPSEGPATQPLLTLAPPHLTTGVRNTEVHVGKPHAVAPRPLEGPAAEPLLTPPHT